MTIGGALSDLNNLLNADDIPCYYKPSIKAVMDTIALSSRDLSSATPQEPRKGSWISSNGVPYTYFNSFIICSECGKHPKEKSDFCPNCGADMRGEEC